MSQSFKKLIKLLVICGLLSWFSANPERVERFFSSVTFSLISHGLRLLFGWLPFSVGDLIYAVIGFYIIVNLYRWIKNMFIQNQRWKMLADGVLKSVNFFLIIYLLFYVLWGLNYSRLDIGHRFGFKYAPALRNDLVAFNKTLIAASNRSKKLIDSLDLPPRYGEELRERTVLAYQRAAVEFPALKYDYPSMKPSLFGTAGDYLGFSGYYNPFTGEAQINTGIPSLEQPFVFCHEVAHQIGFAKENEANFAGYLVASNDDDPRFRYAASLEMYRYANRQLYLRDSATAKALEKELSLPVRKDIAMIKEHYLKFENAIEPLVTAMYSVFLMGNKQPQGIQTYGDVVSLVIAFEKSKCKQ